MISIAVHIVCVWVLGLSMQTKTVQALSPQPEIKLEEKLPEPIPEKLEQTTTPLVSKTGV